MDRKWLIGGAAAAALYYLSQQGVSDTPGEGDPADTNGDGSAAGGTDAGILDEVVVFLGAPDYINAWADAITIHEGWKTGSRSYRNNNPGNLEVDGDLGRDGGSYGIFSTYAKGRDALVGDLTAKVRKYGSWTLYQVMARYAPPKENDTQAYANAIAAALGVSTLTLVRDIAGLWDSQGRTWYRTAFSSSGGAPAPSLANGATQSTTDYLAPQDQTDQFIQAITGIDPGAIDLSYLDFSGDQ